MQVTLRLPDDLARRLKQVANDEGNSVNAYATTVLRAAVDPDFTGDEAERVRARLRAAGILAMPPTSSRRPPSRSAVDAARREAGLGRPLAELVAEDRG